MTARERLHFLVDDLPDEEVDRAERVLAALAEPCTSPGSHAQPPLDDEPETADEKAAVTAAWEDVRAGRMTSQEELERELGLR